MKRGGNENQKASFFIFFDTAPHPKKNKKFIYIPPKNIYFSKFSEKKIHWKFMLHKSVKWEAHWQKSFYPKPRNSNLNKNCHNSLMSNI